MSRMNNLGVLVLQLKCGFIPPETANGAELICIFWSEFPLDEVLTPYEVVDSPQHKRVHPASGGSGRNTHRGPHVSSTDIPGPLQMSPTRGAPPRNP